ncbi:hypothetical protein GSI_08754 [Ganoderma sinense ZZ0214-1]|uniref:Uncharacterized protein n=1 Tax=Ganoderma sinense ZZ0214-1 TaxID=1077348 RepID=A0A2G8S4L2_9APHY|nr:hypothetical protein GSI_08754 [Ganoderma sinense ZZ0214-1]
MDAHIRTLEDDIQRKESNLASLEEVMNHARNDLAHHENTRNSMRIAVCTSYYMVRTHQGPEDPLKLTGAWLMSQAMATFFFPIVPAVLMAVDATSMRVAIEERQRTVCTIEGRLRALSSQLDSRRTQLTAARAERDRVSSLVSQLERRVDDLAAETRQLEAERETLAYLPVRINDCLHALAGNSGLTGSKATSTRNVILGIKSVVEALGSEEMFTGPLKQLNDTIQNLDGRDQCIADRVM